MPVPAGLSQKKACLRGDTPCVSSPVQLFPDLPQQEVVATQIVVLVAERDQTPKETLHDILAMMLV